jgi:hypothetical protein
MTLKYYQKEWQAVVMKKKKQVVNSFLISGNKFRLIFKYFSHDLNAVQIAELNRQSINKY